MPELSLRSIGGIAWCAVLLVVTPYPAAAVLCEIFAPCLHAGPGRFVFVGTVYRVVEEQRGDWKQPDLVAYFRVEERLSESGQELYNPALLSMGHYQVGKSYLIVATPWRDGVLVEWRGDGYRGFQTALACGPAFPLESSHTQQYVDHFRQALEARTAMDYSVTVVDESGEDSLEMPGVLIQLTGKSGSYSATTDEEGEAEFKSGTARSLSLGGSEGRPTV